MKFTIKPGATSIENTDPDVLTSGVPPNGSVCRVHQLDVRIGSPYKMAYANSTMARSPILGFKYVDIIPLVEPHIQDA